MLNLPVVTISDVIHDRVQANEAIVRYSTVNEFVTFAKKLGLMSDLKVSIFC